MDSTWFLKVFCIWYSLRILLIKEDTMAASKIPVWIKQCLDQYGNCACGRAITKKIGKDNLLQILENEGYPCELEILSDQKDKSAYPKDGTYINF